MAKGQHKATYTKDKRKGGYNVRVVGPHANMFAGREVPVTRRGTEAPQMETLDELIFSGVDDGEYNPEDAGKNFAVYSFKARPRDAEEIEF